jgi:hypothetical protein
MSPPPTMPLHRPCLAPIAAWVATTAPALYAVARIGVESLPAGGLIVLLASMQAAQALIAEERRVAEEQARQERQAFWEDVSTVASSALQQQAKPSVDQDQDPQ